MDRNGCLEQIAHCRSVERARHVHAQIEQHMKICYDVFMSNKLLEMYGKCGSIKDAKLIFDGITDKDCFTWVLMLTAYARNGHLLEAKKTFDEMPAWNLVAWTSIMTAYVESGRVRQAEEIFESMPEHDVIPSVVMIAANAHQGQYGQAKKTFSRMQSVNLNSCNAMLTTLAMNRHALEAKYLFDSLPERDLISWNAMLAAYAQNGHLQVARSLFEVMPERDVVSWTVLLCAHAHVGQSDLAIELFSLMKLTELPDDICFVGVLLASSHTGVVQNGLSCFVSMSFDFDIKPDGSHYSCLISLLSRAGYLSEADDLMENMPFVPCALDWRCYLGACRGQSQGLIATQGAIDSDPQVGSTYVLLSDMCRGAAT